METTTKTGTSGIVIGKFGGAFAGFSRAVFNDLVAAGFDNKVSQLMAMDYGSDLGNAMKEDSKLASKVSKANADGECRIRLGGTTAKVRMTAVMSLVRIAQTLDSLHKEELYSRKIDRSLLSETIMHYVERVERTVTTTAWA